MRVIRLILAAVILFVAAPSFAQEWVEYYSRDDRFLVNFPKQPQVKTITYHTEYDIDLPAHVHSYEEGPSRYSVTVVDYSDVMKIQGDRVKGCTLYPDQCNNEGQNELRGALDYAVNPASLADPWFAGTGFTAGAVLPGIVGYEWDHVTAGCRVPTPKILFRYRGPPADADAARYTARSGARVFSAGTLSFARSGHPYALYVPREGKPVFWQIEGSLLGVFDTKYPVQTHKLMPGDKVLLYTDGMDAASFETSPVGTASLIAAADRYRDLAIDELVERLANELFKEVRQTDDLTLLGLEMHS